MSIEFRLKNLEAKIVQIDRLASPSSMYLIGQKAKQLNLDQIKNQIEADGSAVKPYSSKYEEKKGESQVTYISKKLKKGKNEKETKLPAGGHMMFDFDVLHSHYGSVTIGFKSKNARDKATWNTNHRKFIGLTPKNVKLLFDWIRKNFVS